MATQVVLNGTPQPSNAGISTGGFFWNPADAKVLTLSSGDPSDQVFTAVASPVAPPSSRISAPEVTGDQTPRLAAMPNEPPLLTTQDGNVLAFLQKRTFKGKGFNTIFRPRSNIPLPGDQVPGTNDNVLQLNLTQETMTFSESLGNVPNRGFGAQKDLTLKGISYVQRVDDLANPKTGQADGPPTGIHFEPGVWLAVPQCDVSPPNQVATLCRMASIPHGTTINAQGAQPNADKPIPGSQLAGSIPKVDITPFFLPSSPGGPPGGKQPFPSQTFSSSDLDRLPGDLTKFDNKQVRIKEILADPNAFLRNNLADQTAQGQEIVEFRKFDVTTLQTPVLGGGTTNVAFLGGSESSVLLGGKNQNAHAVQMTATFWIETVRAKLSILGQNPKAQSFQPAGDSGPTFIVGPTVGLNNTQIPVTWTQIQYSQTVLLNFGPLSWPHVSVATLAETTKFDVRLRVAA